DMVFGLAIGRDKRWLAMRGAYRASLVDLEAKDAASAATPLKDADRIVVSPPASRWLVTYGSDEREVLLGKLKAAQSSRERRPLQEAIERLVPVAALVDVAANERRVLAAAGEPLGLSADGRWLLTTGLGNVPRLWPLGAPAPEAQPLELTGHAAAVRYAAFSADGRWLVTATSS